MAGMELVRDRKTKTPADTETAQVLALAREKGLILLRAGMHHNVIRTLMLLTIPDEVLDEGLDIIGSALAEVAAKTSPGPLGGTNAHNAEASTDVHRRRLG